MLTRTTLRIDTSLKKAAELQALEDETSLQDIFNKALRQYLNTKAKHTAKLIVFNAHDFKEEINDLSRDDFYSDPAK